jgi:hypothetical protein
MESGGDNIQLGYYIGPNLNYGIILIQFQLEYHIDQNSIRIFLTETDLTELKVVKFIPHRHMT